MEDNTAIPLFKKIDRALFEHIDKFKLTPNYTMLQDFYNGLEEEQQKVFKGFIVLLIFLLPLLGIGFVWWQNMGLKADLELRKSIVTKANEIIGQSQSLQEITPRILSMNPIDTESMMTSRLSGLLSSVGVDLGKIQVKDFVSEMISSTVMKSEANFAFNNLSTDELMNMFTTMIQREKFRISSVEITRNEDSNLLKGQFHAIHYSAFTNTEEEP